MAVVAELAEADPELGIGAAETEAGAVETFPVAETVATLAEELLAMTPGIVVVTLA